jgi:hypothetical protein
LAKGQRTGNAWKTGYTRYKAEGRHAKNKIRNLKKHLEKNPKDLQGRADLKRLEDEVKFTRNRPSGKTQNMHTKRVQEWEARLARANKHREQFGKNESRDASPSDIYTQIMSQLSRALAGDTDRKLLQR